MAECQEEVQSQQKIRIAGKFPDVVYLQRSDSGPAFSIHIGGDVMAGDFGTDYEIPIETVDLLITSLNTLEFGQFRTIRLSEAECTEICLATGHHGRLHTAAVRKLRAALGASEENEFPDIEGE